MKELPVRVRGMALTAIVLALGVALLAVPAGADSFGVVPTLTKEKPKGVETRAESPPEFVAGNDNFVLGLEAFSWFGPQPSVGLAVSGKTELGGGWELAKARFYAGWLVGVTEPDLGSRFATGGFVEMTMNDIPALAVLVRLDGDSVLISPGVNVTLIGWR